MMILLKKIKNSLLILILLLFSQKVIGQKILPNINIGNIRKDMLAENEFMFPDNHIQTLSEDMLNVFYLDEFCLVHIPYKNTSTYSSDMFSLLMIYIEESERWKFYKSVPYYYNLQLLDKDKKIFLSKNLFCGMDGNCNSCIEIAQFNGKEIQRLAHHEGVNKTLFYDRLLTFGEIEKVKKAKGDTLCMDYEVSEINIDDNVMGTYLLTKSESILSGINNDLLILKNSKTRKIVNFKMK